MVDRNTSAQQARAQEHWEEQRTAFIFNASIQMQNAQGPLAGLLIEKGAPDYGKLKSFLAEVNTEVGQPLLIGMLERQAAVKILEAGGFRDIRQWMEESRLESRFQLPIIIVTRDGAQARIEEVPQIGSML